jgi:hypothetical protein
MLIRPGGRPSLFEMTTRDGFRRQSTSRSGTDVSGLTPSGGRGRRLDAPLALRRRSSHTLQSDRLPTVAAQRRSTAWSSPWSGIESQSEAVHAGQSRLAAHRGRLKFVCESSRPQRETNLLWRCGYAPRTPPSWKHSSTVSWRQLGWTVPPEHASGSGLTSARFVRYTASSSTSTGPRDQGAAQDWPALTSLPVNTGNYRFFAGDSGGHPRELARTTIAPFREWGAGSRRAARGGAASRSRLAVLWPGGCQPRGSARALPHPKNRARWLSPLAAGPHWPACPQLGDSPAAPRLSALRPSLSFEDHGGG